MIRADYVLSAAHCVVKENTAHTLLDRIRISAGSAHLKQFKQQRNAAKIFIIDKYDMILDATEYDIALIKLEQPFILSNTIQVASLPDLPPLVGEELTPVGWGIIAADERTNVLRYAEMIVTNNDECQEAKLGSEGIFCTLNSDTTTCYGDSGGPYYKKDTNVVVGIVSGGLEDPETGTCSTKNVDIVTNVYHYLDWINDVLKLQ